MAEMATYIGIEPRTVIAKAATTITRGLRVVLDSTGNAVLQDNTAKGDHVAVTDAVAGQPFEVASIYGGGKVAAVASEATNPGDLAYTATNGQFSKTAASNVLIGRWVQGASGAGVLGEVELQA